MNVLLDTNTVSYAIRGHEAVLRRLTAQPMETLAISSITAAELLHGLARRPQATKLHALVHEFLLRVEVLPWERVVAERYAQARATMEKQGINLSALDWLIAAHALSLDRVLITHDRAFSKIEGLRWEDWSR